MCAVADGMCPAGVAMTPNDTYTETNYYPIGTISAWDADSSPTDKYQLNETIYSSNSGPFTSACCAK